MRFVDPKRKAELQAAMRRGDYGALVRKEGEKPQWPLEEKSSVRTQAYELTYELFGNVIQRLGNDYTYVRDPEEYLDPKRKDESDIGIFMKGYIVFGKIAYSFINFEVPKNVRAEVIGRSHNGEVLMSDPPQVRGQHIFYTNDPVIMKVIAEVITAKDASG